MSRALPSFLWNGLEGDADTLLRPDFNTWRNWTVGVGVVVVGIAVLLAPVRRFRGIAAGLVIGIVAAGMGLGSDFWLTQSRPLRDLAGRVITPQGRPCPISARAPIPRGSQADLFLVLLIDPVDAPVRTSIVTPRVVHLLDEVHVAEKLTTRRCQLI